MDADDLMLALAVLAVLPTLLPLLRHSAWWIRVFDFPRLQITVITALVLAAYVAVAGWRDLMDIGVMTALALCIGYQCLRIARYTPLFPHQLRSEQAPQSDQSISMVVCNVLTPNRQSERLLDHVRDLNPDIVLAIETDDWWQRQLDELEADYPYALKQPLDNLYGMHLYSRLELKDAKILYLVKDDVPSMHATVVLRNGHSVDLHCLHPEPPSPTENPSSKERDSELLLLAQKLEPGSRSTVVMGDLNDVAWSATSRLFQKISGLLDPRIGRGFFNTYHAQFPLLRWPLDHVFCSPDFTLVSMARLSEVGSDHFPIHVVLQHSPGADECHESPDASAEDLEVADQKIDHDQANEEAVDRL